MIHLIEVGPELLPAELKKLSRRYAMTGGYEIRLRAGLSPDDLRKLKQVYTAEMEKEAEYMSRRRSSNAFRIIAMIKQCLETQESEA